MKYTLEQLHQSIFHSVYEVYDIFKNFFGEDKVDLQFHDTEGIMVYDPIYIIPSNIETDNLPDTDLTDDEYEDAVSFAERWQPYIYVWWPEVTVTNEHDRSEVIRDLYAEIKISQDGRLPLEYHGFKLAKATYTRKQYLSGYVHSHVPSFSSAPPKFQNPCLGRGPINQTIASLKTQNDSALWMLFCQELALYVTVESLAGIPYIKLETIGTSNRRTVQHSNYDNQSELPEDAHIDKETLKDFILYYLKNGHLSFDFYQNRFDHNMPYFDYIIDVSNAFIDWFNENGTQEQVASLYQRKILREVIAADGKLYYTNSLNEQRVLSLSSQKILTFKGQDITVHISDPVNDEERTTLILDHFIAMYILYNIINVINYHYKDEFTINTDSTSESSNNSREQISSSTSSSQAVCYL